MTVPFGFEPGAGGRMPRIVPTEHWNLDVLGQYELSRADAVCSMVDAGVAEHELTLSVDRERQVARSQELTEALARLPAEVEDRTRRTAVLVNSASLQRQASRTSTFARTCICDDVTHALHRLAPSDGETL